MDKMHICRDEKQFSFTETKLDKTCICKGEKQNFMFTGTKLD